MEWARSADCGNLDITPHEVGLALESALTPDAPVGHLVLANPVGDGTVSIAVFRLGLHGEVGVFVAASERKDFPTQVESLLLQVAANQAAIGLQEARHLRQQRRTTEELEQRVVERTAELAAVNDELRKEVLERTRREERMRQDRRELRLLVDFVPQFIGELNPDGTIRYINRAGLEYLGRTLAELTQSGDHHAKMYHPDALATVRNAVDRALSLGASCEVETRMRRHDGQYRWFLMRFEPFRDDDGHIIRWYGTGNDIDDRKRAEERMYGENLALREQVAQASMFEEIVGVSPPLRAVLSQVSKVAPTDSTVLITGETGTGKELLARAIHKRSRRAARAFISLNCAVIPPALIASELFGHEKGAFTGALQRRLGRFELAEGGTIFLDEIGELPAETQVALLRVLQERAFERVGGTEVIRVDVRVIVATNRDLAAAIAAGSFRRDLFYRLNVFPVEMPPLRARTDDLPMLVEYFTDRYGSKAGKRIHGVDQETLALLRSYAWPGNIRELQNVIERAVILCETDTLSVDQSWLPRSLAAAGPPDSRLTDAVQAHEKTLIESALAASRGRVAGRHGAAARLGMPASTLDAKIRSMKINKHQYKEP
jgi:formate hydrogenlyase transcriptional activator